MWPWVTKSVGDAANEELLTISFSIRAGVLRDRWKADFQGKFAQWVMRWAFLIVLCLPQSPSAPCAIPHSAALKRMLCYIIILSLNSHQDEFKSLGKQHVVTFLLALR